MVLVWTVEGTGYYIYTSNKAFADVEVEKDRPVGGL